MKLPAMPVRSAGDATLNFQKLAPQIPVFVSTLPTQPNNAQEVYFQNEAMAAQGVTWHLRYRAASTSVHKWEFVGGGALGARVDTQESTTSTAYIDLATAGPSVVAPFAGDYEIVHGCWLLNNGAGGVGKWSQAALNISGVDETTAIIATFSTGNVWYSSTRAIRRTVASGVTVKMQYATQAGTGTFQYRELLLRPIRVG